MCVFVHIFSHICLCVQFRNHMHSVRENIFKYMYYLFKIHHFWASYQRTKGPHGSFGRPSWVLWGGPRGSMGVRGVYRWSVLNSWDFAQFFTLPSCQWRAMENTIKFEGMANIALKQPPKAIFRNLQISMFSYESCLYAIYGEFAGQHIFHVWWWETRKYAPGSSHKHYFFNPLFPFLLFFVDFVTGNSGWAFERWVHKSWKSRWGSSEEHLSLRKMRLLADSVDLCKNTRFHFYTYFHGFLMFFTFFW